MLFELEQECLEVYRRKVDQANRSRAQLRQAIADCEAELAAICSAMGERPVHIRQVRHFSNSIKLLIFVFVCVCVCYLNMVVEKLNLKIII
jgi:protein regulator of cytokinesis 1